MQMGNVVSRVGVWVKCEAIRLRISLGLEIRDVKRL